MRTIQRRGVFLLLVYALSVFTLPVKAQNSLDDAQRLNEKVDDLYQQGRYIEAIPLAERALEIRKRLLGDFNEDVATSLSYLGLLYQGTGRYDKAEPLLLQATEIRKRVLGEGSHDYATSLNNLAELYRETGRYDKAEPVYLTAKDIFIKRSEAVSSDYATCLNNLALLYEEMGGYYKAEPLLLQAVGIYKKVLGDTDPDYAQSLNNLAGLYENTGRYEKAEPLLLQAAEIVKSALGEEHPLYAASLSNLATLYQATDRPDRALSTQTRALQIEQRNIERVFSFSSESAMRDYIATFSGSLNGLLSMVAVDQRKNASAINAALVWTLRRKGIILDTLIRLRHFRQLESHDPQVADLALRLHFIKQQLSNLALKPSQDNQAAAYGQNKQKLKEQGELLEAELTRKLSLQNNVPPASSAVEIEDVRRKLAPNSVLVEFVRANVYSFTSSAKGQHWGTDHYFVLILPKDPGKTIPMIDLGEAKRIDDAITSLRQNIYQFGGSISADRGA